MNLGFLGDVFKWRENYSPPPPPTPSHPHKVINKDKYPACLLTSGSTDKKRSTSFSLCSELFRASFPELDNADLFLAKKINEFRACLNVCEMGLTGVSRLTGQSGPVCANVSIYKASVHDRKL